MMHVCGISTILITNHVFMSQLSKHWYMKQAIELLLTRKRFINCVQLFVGFHRTPKGKQKHWKRESVGKCTCKNRSTGLQSNTWQYIKNREKEDRAAISISLTQHSIWTRCDKTTKQCSKIDAFSSSPLNMTLGAITAFKGQRTNLVDKKNEEFPG